jgi:hypothetical protein
VAQETIPTLKLRFNGQISEVSAPPRPKLIINLNGQLNSAESGNKNLERFVDSLDDEDEDYADEDIDAIDRWDGPESWFEPGETTFAVDRTYVFCPAAHRKQLLRIFIRHFCEHPLLPDRSGTTRTAAQIRYDAVWEMYKYCEQRGLREVWGYMWTAWYCPAKYKLWARSSQPEFIGRWRTTMAVENFWRNLKHETLHHLLHPRLDQLIYLIATDVLPAFEAKMQNFESDHRAGRVKSLTPWQKAFKQEWKKLAARKLGTCTYNTCVADWTCSCGQQKYNAYLLCKHLVHAVCTPDPAFFWEVRRRVIPFYWHPLLKPKDGPELDQMDDPGSITDGDHRGKASGEPSRGLKRKHASPPKNSAKNPFLISSSPSPICEDEESEEVRDHFAWLICSTLAQLYCGRIVYGNG